MFFFFFFQSITRVIPGVGLYFSSLHWLKHSLHLNEQLTPVEAVLLGVTARTMSGGLLIPITVVKTRFEVILLRVFDHQRTIFQVSTRFMPILEWSLQVQQYWRSFKADIQNGRSQRTFQWLGADFTERRTFQWTVFDVLYATKIFSGIE